MLNKLKKRWIGDKAFYHATLVIAVPTIIQQLVTSFVNMLDNIMVGQTGTLQMSAVSISNQMITIFNLAIWGSISAVSIFGAQFNGKKDYDGARNCFRLKLVIELLFALLGILIFIFFHTNFISLYLHSDTNTLEEINATMGYASNYLLIMTIGFIPFALSQCLSSSIRETGETRLSMIASLAAVTINFIGNSILIFGLFGFPALGSMGAAIATVIARYCEFGINLFFALYNRARFPFFTHVFENFHIPFSLFKDIVKKGSPLVVNEILWSIGIAGIAQCYSTRGIDAVAAYNITNTIENLFFVFNIAMGDSISIIVGQLLGAGKLDEAMETDRKLIFFTAVISFLLGMTLFSLAPVFPRVYNTTDEIRTLASSLLKICGLTMWIAAIYNACYFTMRCGGKTIITFLFDSVGTICVSFPIAFILSRFTDFTITQMFLTLHLVDLYKVILGLFLLNKGIWVNNLVQDQ